MLTGKYFLMQKIAFTLCSNNYLAQAKTLGDSLIKHNPEYHFIIGLVDKRHSEIDYGFFSPHEIIEVEQIGIEDNERLILKYNIVEYNTAVKPFYFQFLFEKFETETVTYFDPDINIYSKLDELEEIYKTHDFVLTPHLLKAEPFKIPEKEQLVLNVGAYNLGFLGLRRSTETDLFLKFFQHRMRDKCYVDFCNGLFVDQIWANLIPCYFDKYYIWKDPGCNVGYWNFSERRLGKDKDTFIVNTEFVLKFFHISNYDPLTPEKLCKWLSYSFEARPDLKGLYDAYGKELLNNKYAFFSELQPLLAFPRNHPFLDKKPEKILNTSRNRWGLRFRNLSNKIINEVFDLR